MISYNWFKLAPVCICLCSVLTSCTTVDLTTGLIEQELSQSSKNSDIDIPPQILDALLLNDKDIDASDEKFDVSVKSMPAKEFFVGLMQNMNKNIVAHPDVSGQITLNLKQVTLQDVMNILRDIYGFEYKVTNGIYSVYPKALRTEIFEVNYLDVTREGTTDSSVSIGAIASGNQQGGQGQNNNQQGGQNNQQNGQNNQGATLGSGAHVATSNQTDFWDDLDKTLNLVIDTTEKGKKITVNPQSGLVIVTALPNEINAIRNLLKRSEINIQRQVIIEAKILEVNLFKSFESGVNWSIIEGNYEYSSNSTFERVSGAISETSSELFSSILRVGDLTRLVSLLEKQGTVQVLSSPRVSTVNNQKALIRVGSDEFFVTGISNQTVTSAAATSTAPDIQLTSFFSGISLDVTPQISGDNHVVLHVHPVVSSVSDQEKNIELGDESFTLPLALREVRESDSIVKARNGEVIVLGGLMQESTDNVKGKRPFLGDIPFLNTLFKTKNKLSKKSELIILLRPIVVDKQGFKGDIDNTYKRMREI